MSPTLLALTATTMALGILYYGLPGRRYRAKLLELIEAAFRSEQVSEETKSKISKSVLADSNLADDYHELAKWLNELPADVRESLKDTSADLFAEVGIARGLPQDYLWFKRNLDNGTCFFVAVIIPLACLWTVHCYPKASSPHMHWFENILIVGQAWIGAHAIYGAIMAPFKGWRFKLKLREFIAKFEGRVREGAFRIG